MAVFDPNRKRNARGEQRLEELLRAAAAVFARSGYQDATTNAIASEAGVSPATLYQFFPNKEALADALTARYARQMAGEERAIDADGTLSLAEAVASLLEASLRFHRKYPAFHTLLAQAPLSATARQEKEALADVFVGFVADRLRRAATGLSRAQAIHHAEVSLMIFKGILAEIAHAKPAARARLQRSLRDAILRYLEPLTAGTRTDPTKRSRS